MRAETYAAWPFPSDSPVVKARRIAMTYRTALLKADPDACALIDRQARGWGQTWATGGMLAFDMDDYLTARQAAELACVQVRQLSAWRRHGRITGRPKGHTYEYRAGDVLAMSTTPRGRTPR